MSSGWHFTQQGHDIYSKQKNERHVNNGVKVQSDHILNKDNCYHF